MITKISLPKLTFLLIITLGLYSLLWIARRRNEIVESYGLSVPRWQWLVVPYIVLCILSGVLTYVSLTALSFSLAVIIINVFVFLASFAYLGVSIWWMVKFGIAVERITNGKLPLLWTLLYWIFLSIGLIFVTQHAFNKLSAKKVKLPEKVTERPSKKFVTLSIVVISVVYFVCIMLGVVIGVLSSVGGDPEAAKRRDAAIAEQLKKSEILAKEYDGCVAELDRNYPEVMSDQYDAYEKAYEACEAIRIEQNKAVEKYNELLLEGLTSIFE